MKIRLAGPDDAAALSHVHAETWEDTCVGRVPDALAHERLATARERDWVEHIDLRVRREAARRPLPARPGLTSGRPARRAPLTCDRGAVEPGALEGGPVSREQLVGEGARNPLLVPVGRPRPLDDEEPVDLR
jgi:hypothetical protein